MLGELLFKIRTDKKITKANLAHKTSIDPGHIAHIEKNERTPSHKALKKICTVLDVPYQQLMYAYDKDLSEEHKKYEIINHIAYNSVPAVPSLDDLIFCPTEFGNANLAVQVEDTSMEPTLIQGSYAFIEFNSPLDNKNIGLFYYKDAFLIRRFIIRKDFLILKSDNKLFNDIKVDSDDDFYIVGKILGTNNDY